MGAPVGTSSGVKSEPNVVPMIDIMLVLLIIFMIVTPVISSGFQARIPQGKNIESRPEEGGDVLLGIDREGNYYLGVDDARGQSTISPIAAERLKDVLSQIFESRTTDKILYFKADANLTYADVEAAIMIARSAGVRVLAAITEEKREGLFQSKRGGD
ncbi:MAG TPA: biopolymer transporter ExbD [Gemmatimonadales bacterium]